MKVFTAAVNTGAVLFLGTALTLYAQRGEEKQAEKPQAPQAQRAQPQQVPQHAQPQKAPQRAQPQQAPRAPQQQPERAQQQKAPQRAEPQKAPPQGRQPEPQHAAQAARQPQQVQKAAQPRAPEQARQQPAQRAQQAQQQPARPQQAKQEPARPQQAQQAPPQRSETLARSWQQKRGWQQGGGWSAQTSFQGDRAHNWNSDHRTWAQRGGYGGYYVPQASFNLYFGSEHFFRLRTMPVMYLGYPRFEYNGFSFMMVDPWPESWAANWYASDDVYIVYNNGYYMYDRRYPQTGIAISLIL